MSRYIDADALITDIEERYCKPCKEKGEDYHEVRCRACWVDDAIGEIDGFADNSIDLEPKRGEWKIEKTESVWGKGYMLTCSVCGDTFRVTENALPYEKYCRNCGASMREREGE